MSPQEKAIGALLLLQKGSVAEAETGFGSSFANLSRARSCLAPPEAYLHAERRKTQSDF